MLLTYWVASHPNPRLSIRSKTKWEAGMAVGEAEDEYGPVAKVQIEYESGLDLMLKCMDGDFLLSLDGLGPGVVLSAEIVASPPPPIKIKPRQGLTFEQAMEKARAGKLVARSWWPSNHVQLLGEHTLVLRSGGLYDPAQSTSGDDDQSATDWVILRRPR